MENAGDAHLNCKTLLMAIRITIPEPCSENWDAMTPQGDGRHCGQCCKVVVDFTGMEPRQITDYLMRHREQKVCGRFSNAHLDTPLPWTPDEYAEKVALSPLNWLQKMAAIVVLAFGLLAGGCTMGVQADNNRTTGEPAPVEIQAPVDTMKIMGEIAPPQPGDTIQKTPGKTRKAGTRKPECVAAPQGGETMGVPALPEEPVIQDDVQMKKMGEVQVVPDTAQYGPNP